MRPDSGKISIVDDDDSIRRGTGSLLRSVGYQVKTFASAELFLESGAIRETDCLVLDVRMPGIGGLELQRRLNALQSHVPIIFITAHDDKSYRITAMAAGAAHFFHKPFEVSAFVAAIQAVLHGLECSEAIVSGESTPASEHLLTELTKPLMQQASSGEAAEDGTPIGARKQKA